MCLALSTWSMCSIYMEIYCFRSQCKKWSSKSNREKLWITHKMQIIWSFSLIEPSNSRWSCFKFLLDSCVQSTLVCDAAYSVQWYNHSTKLKKILQMVIMRAQRPCMIYAGPSVPVTLEHFRKVSHISLCNSMIFLYKISVPCRNIYT